MKKFLKIVLEIILAIAILALILLFMMFSAKSEIVPEIYVTSDSGKVAKAIRGGYQWNSFSESMVVDGIAPEDYIYTSNNILLVSPGEKMTFQNSDNPWNCYKFYQLEMSYYNEANEKHDIPAMEDSKAYADLKYLELNAPTDEGTYVYHFKFSYYNKGEVSYGLKVVVSTEPNYEILDLIRYRNTKLTDVESIHTILNLLPYSKYKKGIILKLNTDRKELVIQYDEFIMEREELLNNIIALLTLIPDCDQITYETEKEAYRFTREEIEFLVGRNLSDYADNMDLWKQEVLFKDKITDEISTRDEIYKAVITDIVSELKEDDDTEIALDTKTFQEAEDLKISNVDRQEILNFVSSFTNVVYDISYDEYKNLNHNQLFLALVSMKNKASMIAENSGDSNIVMGQFPMEQESGNILSGDILEDKNRYICTMMVSLHKNSKLYYYEVEFKNGKWNITKIEKTN